MGEHAEDILNGDVDQYSGEWIGNGQGYPRSFLDTKKYTCEGSVKGSIKKVQEYFKDYQTQVLSGTGMNIKLPGNGTVTVWWTKAKWMYSKRPHQWFYFKNAPKEHPYELIAQIEGLMGIRTVAPIIVAPVSSITATNGVQTCIDHIEKKLGLIEKTKPNAVAQLVLTNLLSELQQYL